MGLHRWKPGVVCRRSNWSSVSLCHHSTNILKEEDTMGLGNVVSVRVLIHPTRDGAEAECFMVGAEDSPTA